MVDPQENIFDFNHIHTTLSKGTCDVLKNVYTYYHKNHYSYTKEKNLICNVTGKAVITSAVTGGITLNPIVLTSLTVFGVIVKIVVGAMQDDKKIARANFTSAEYKKSLDVIWFYLRGDPDNEKEFLD